jgi:Tol biopolymer transport system component
VRDQHQTVRLWCDPIAKAVLAGTWLHHLHLEVGDLGGGSEPPGQPDLLGAVIRTDADCLVGGWEPPALRTAGINVFNGDLWVLNADGSQVQLTNDGHEGTGAFSPDGTKVVFSRTDDGPYVVDVEARTPRLIVKSQAGWSFGSPAWSPDGSRIAYTTYMDAPQRFIWTVNPDGTDPRQLVDLCQCGGLAWSPDGSMLAFHSRRDNLGGATAPQQIYTVRADGSGLHPLNVDGFQPAWSPDGSRIAYLRDYGFAELGLYTMARDGSDARIGEGVFVMPSSVAWNPVH